MTTPTISALSSEDVRAAVLAARERGLPFAVRATGHGTHAPIDGCLVLDTSAMAEVLVDPDRQVATVGPGARWGDVIAAAAPFGLAPLSGSSPDVGVTGYTLGGGVGWLARRHGFAADSLLRADVVTADGERLTATADRRSELFWALRGGGGNFGVVTRLDIRLYPVSRAYGGVATFPVERAADILARYRDWAVDQPHDLTTTVMVRRSSVAVCGFFAGEAEDGRRALKGLLDAAGPPLADEFRPMDYAEARTIGGTAPRRLELFEELPDAVIDAVAAAPADAVEVRHWGGAMARDDADLGPVGHRQVPFSITVDGPADASAPLARHATGGSFLNWLHDVARTESAYTPANWRRLRELKRAYDPDNVFAFGHNIPPAAAAAVRSSRSA